MSKVLDSICVYAEKNNKKLLGYSLVSAIAGAGLFFFGTIWYMNIINPETRHFERIKEIHASVTYNAPSLEEVLRDDSLLSHYTNIVNELDNLKYLDKIERNKLTEGYRNSSEYYISNIISTTGASILLLDVLFNLGVLGLGPYNLNRKKESTPRT